MSYILDALRKAEHDRNRGEVPGIEDLQTTKSSEKKSFNQWGWVALAVINVLLLGLLFWPDAEKDSAEQQVASVKPPQLSLKKMPVNQPQSSLSKSMTAVAAHETLEVQKSDDSLSNPVYPQKAKEIDWTNIDDRSLQPIPPPPVVPEESQSSQRKAVAKSNKARESTGKVTFLKESEAMQPARAGDTPEMTLPESAGDGLAIWPQIPSNIFSQLQGNLRMDVHVYAQLPEERFVLINLGKYHEGEEMQEGPYIEEITEHGVILEFSGERFLLPAN